MAKLVWESEFSIKTGSGDMATAVRVDEIIIGHRLRSVDQAKVDALKVSIADLGLRTPISLFLGGDDQRQMFLAAGAHRLEAVRQLGREWIAAVVREEDEFDAELWEIDENLCRAELTPADRALFVFRRKELYLMKHPETAQGATGRGGYEKGGQVGHLSDVDSKSFATATAEATGQSERAVRRDSERGEKISEQALRMLRGTRHDKGVVLDRLKSLRAEEQTVYVRALFEVDKAKEAEAKEIRTEKMSTKRAVRTGLINAIAAHGKVTAGEMPRAAFPIGYCDFPWEQEAWSEATGQDRGLMYPAMSVEDGRALCAGDQSPFTPDALLFFWVTTNRFADGLSIVEAWGFRYVTAITWDKVNIGMGRWVRDRTEHLLICKRGDFPGLEMGTQPESLYSEVKTEHSRKPMWFAKEIDRLFPDMRKLELFQRKESLHFADVRHGPTWSFWGFEAGGVDKPDAAANPVAPAPDVPASKLPPGPGKNAPVEFTVGGMRKGSFARFSVHLNDDATYSIAAECELAGFRGGASPLTGTIGTFESALRHGLAAVAGQLRPVISDASTVCTSGHKAAARAGLKWIEARMEEWGLAAKPLADTRLSAAASKPPKEPKPPKKPKPPKEPKSPKRSEFEIERETQRALRVTYRETLPADDEGLIGRAWEELRTYDRAVRAGAIGDMKDAADRIRAIYEHAFGLDPLHSMGGGPPDGNGRFNCLHDASTWLKDALAAPDGDVPLFGQPGRFLIELFGCRVDFKYSGLFGYSGGDAHVVDLDKPFFSDTGYRSFMVSHLDGETISEGLDVRSYLESVCTLQFTEGGKKKVKLHDGPFGLNTSEDGPRESWILQRRETDPAYLPGGFLYDAASSTAAVASEVAA
ncbi:MT-A70 family methyltransferase [Rhizobium sp. NFR03]|uniref:MT-A70 family methyltransferase n=1 Tax=Rhizobium sp. NFR03 TaxID=1566263 RepID=UPI0008CD31FD|nr:MT-A70 family methyltransferase [Rhizobium sp. NFR03]SER58111.1 N6-adenosine-specific RNA methylase IME4 [Rhizobium sp. NFR03]